MSLLQVDDISKLYKNGRGVRQVSFSLHKGDVFGLIGPNGAGKTTLLKMLTGLIRPDHGSIRLFGHNVAQHHEQAMEQVGCVIETADAYDDMHAVDNLTLAARFYPELPGKRIDEILEQVGLAPYKLERVKGYSLGMKQRLALASALLANPQLVILDEPTNGLDIEGMMEVRKTIQRLAREQGITFLISSHMIHDLGMIANRIGIMASGRLIRLADVNEWMQAGMTLEQYVVTHIQAAKEAVGYESIVREHLQ